MVNIIILIVTCSIMVFGGVITACLSKTKGIILTISITVIAGLYISFTGVVVLPYYLSYLGGIVFAVVINRHQAKKSSPEPDTTWNSIDINSNGETVITPFKVYKGGK